MTTVLLADVPPGKLYPTLDPSASMRSLLAKPVEAMACAARRLVACDTRHAFARAAHDAFYDHNPLVIRPDDIWFCIAQGFATHVGANAEELRSRFVAHQEKKRLVVDRPDFVIGQENPWPEVFEAFSEQIGSHVGGLRDLVCARFSTSTPIEAAAFDVCLMDTFQGYFDYEMRAGCGIPAITLLGTPEDWASMLPRVRHLGEFGLETWVDALLPVLQKIADTARGEIDKQYWRSFFRYQSGSGPAEMTGWINTLFPYLLSGRETKRLVPNPYLANWQERWHTADEPGRSLWPNSSVQGPSLRDLPEGLVSAPVKLIDRHTNRESMLRFVAGMVGVDQDESTGALAASFGWAVLRD